MSTDVTSVTKSLDRIADALESGGSGGSSCIEKVTITPTGNISNVSGGTADKTYEELMEAYNSEKLVVADITIGNGYGPESRRVPLVLSPENKLVGLAIVQYQPNNWIYLLNIKISSNGVSLSTFGFATGNS